jgi:hypothetical protein
MNRIKSLALTVGMTVGTVATSGALTPALAVNLVQNGDFAINNLTSTTVRERGLAANPPIGTGSSGLTSSGTATAANWNLGTTSGKLNWLVSMGNAYRDNLNIKGGRSDGTQQLYGTAPILNPIVGSPDFGTTNGFYVVADGDPGFADTITQTITGLTPGQSYAVSFYQAAAQQRTFFGGTTEQWAVNLGNTVLTTSNYTTAGQLSALMSPIQPFGPGLDVDVVAPNGPMPVGQTNTATAISPWQQQTLFFTPTSATSTLSFLAVGLPGGKPPFSLLTGVSVEAVAGAPTAAVPEPFTIIGTIVGGTAAFRLRKKLAKSTKNS